MPSIGDAWEGFLGFKVRHDTPKCVRIGALIRMPGCSLKDIQTDSPMDVETPVAPSVPATPCADPSMADTLVMDWLPTQD